MRGELMEEQVVKLIAAKKSLPNTFMLLSNYLATGMPAHHEPTWTEQISKNFSIQVYS